MEHITMSQNIAYIRVSSVDQNTSRQLKDSGITFDKTFTDKASAKDTNRPQLQAMLNHVREGDTVHVHSMDRLARNQGELLALVEDLTGRGVTVQFHKESLTFTGGDNPFSKLMLGVLGAVAEFERSLINERRKEGQKAAKEAGKHIGRPPMEEDRKQRVINMLSEGLSVYRIAKDLKMSRNTISKIQKELEGN